MAAWLTIAGYAFQLLIMWLQNKAESDKAEQARKDALHVQAASAIKSGDVSNITAVFDKLRT